VTIVDERVPVGHVPTWHDCMNAPMTLPILKTATRRDTMVWRERGECALADDVQSFYNTLVCDLATTFTQRVFRPGQAGPWDHAWSAFLAGELRERGRARHYRSLYGDPRYARRARIDSVDRLHEVAGDSLAMTPITPAPMTVTERIVEAVAQLGLAGPVAVSERVGRDQRYCATRMSQLVASGALIRAGRGFYTVPGANVEAAPKTVTERIVEAVAQLGEATARAISGAVGKPVDYCRAVLSRLLRLGRVRLTAPGTYALADGAR